MNFKQVIEDSIAVKQKLLLDIAFHNVLQQACDMCMTALDSGKKILIAGNGGSAADAQHIAAELVVRYSGAKRVALPAIALTTDSSILTAIANDFGYEHFFSRQLQALSQPGDVFIAISTSGQSENIIKAINVAKQRQLYVIGLTGINSMKNNCDITLKVPSEVTARIQEAHIMIGHMICEYIDSQFIKK